MATYLNDLRLTELATGEGSGTWGTTTNLSLELIGEALGFATQQVFGSDADATTTIADGASDPARAMYFKITSAGSLTATRTCTIAPNTISRVMFIENATTGSQSIQISQGSGASVTILTGKTAVVYLDGAGSGAAVVDAMAGVDPGVTDTLAEVLAAGNTSGANNLIIDNGQAITTNTINETTAASGVTIDSVLLKDDGVNATNLEITNIKANDGTSAGSIADSTGIVTLASSVLTTADINGGTIDGTTLGATTPASVAATTLSTTGAATFSGDVGIGGAPLANNQLLLTDAGTYSQFHMQNSTSGSGASDGFRILMDGVNTTITNHETGYMAFETQNTERLRIDSAGAATFSGAVTIGSATGQNSVFGTIIGSGGANEGAVIVSSATGKGWLGFNNGNNASIPGQLTYDHATNVLSLYSSGTVSVTGAATFSGAVESTKFNTAADRAVLDAPSGDGRFRVSTNSTTYGFFRANTSVIQIGTDSVEPLDFHTNNVFRMRLDGNGNLGVGVAPSADNFYTTLEIGNTGNGLVGRGPADTHFMSGLIWDGTSTQEYTVSSVAVGKYQITNGIHSWGTAPAGTAGTAATLQTNMILDVSGNFLVGKTAVSLSTVGLYQLATGAMGVTRDDGAALSLNRLTSDGDVANFYKEGGLVGSIGADSGYLHMGQGSTNLLFVDTGQSRVIPRGTVNTASNGFVDLGDSGSRFKDLYLSGGVYLGGTGAANLLDDYEEGTFTPTFVNLGTGTLAVQSGKYTKIGNQVICHIYLAIATLGTASGFIVVGGLPFSAANVGSLYGSTSAVHGTGWTTATAGLQGLVAPNDTQVSFYEGMASLSSGYDTAMADIGTGNLLFSITYTTA
jgi:hypothetical protein